MPQNPPSEVPTTEEGTSMIRRNLFSRHSEHGSQAQKTTDSTCLKHRGRGSEHLREPRTKVRTLVGGKYAFESIVLNNLHEFCPNKWHLMIILMRLFGFSFIQFDSFSEYKING